MDGRGTKLFEPLTYSADFHKDASFYAGYLLMKEGEIARSTHYLQNVIVHPMYGAYANAYIAEGELSSMQYSQALASAERTLQARGLPSEVLTRSIVQLAWQAAIWVSYRAPPIIWSNTCRVLALQAD